MNDFRAGQVRKVTKDVVAQAKNLKKNESWDLQLDPKMLEFVCMAKRRHVWVGVLDRSSRLHTEQHIAEESFLGFAPRAVYS